MKTISGRKILVIGPNGSGKTTFAKKLSQKINIPYYELDNIYWKPNWGESSNDEFRTNVDNVTSNIEWIVDGNYARNQDLTLARADTIIWLDYPFIKIIYRVLKRTIVRSITKEPLWHNNKESLSRMFSKDSIILFAIRSYKRKSRRYGKLMNSEEAGEINWVRISNKREESEFWNQLIR